LLALAGGGLGVILSVWFVAILNAVVSYQDNNRFEPFSVDRWVLAFTMALAALVAAAFGILPLRTADHVNVVDALKDSSPGTTGVSQRHLRRSLVVVEIALAIVLVASAIVLTRSAAALHALDRGVTVDGVMTAQVALNDQTYGSRRRLVETVDAIV